MKTILLSVCFIFLLCGGTKAQSGQTTDHVIEGGKVIVELIKVFAAKKDQGKDTGCRGRCADVCAVNESGSSITILFQHRDTEEKREMVILPQTKECCLQTGIGVWTYDLRVSGTAQSIRKGDVLIEASQNLTMNIKF